MKALAACWTLIWLMMFSFQAQAEQTLTVGLMVFNGPQRTAYLELQRRFQQANPGTHIRWQALDEGPYKAHIVHLLKDPKGPDVLYWQAGNRLFHLVKKGLVAPIDGLWQKAGFDNDYSPAIIDTVRYQGHIYAVPYSYYQWGFYYRASVLARHHLQPPGDWKQMLSFCHEARRSGMAAFAVGIKYNWPSAAWFDYLDLRLNGLAFHHKVTAGEVPFTDPRIRNVFEHWKQLLDARCFNHPKDSTNLEWRDVLPQIYHGESAMILMGNFLDSQLPPLLKSDIRFLPFPRIKAAIPDAEEAPTDVYLLPKREQHNQLAKRFLTFMGSASVQSFLNNKTGKLSTNSHAKVSDDPLIQAGRKLLENASGLSQFFDRDAPKPLANAGIRAFTQFMVDRNIDEAIQKLEKAREALPQNSPTY